VARPAGGLGPRPRRDLVCRAPLERSCPDREFAFLPPDSPSRRAEEVFAKAFPEDRRASNIVLVLHRTDQATTDLPRDLAFIDDALQPELRKIAEAEGGLADEAPPSDEPLFDDQGSSPRPPRPKPLIAHIRTPNDPAAGALLVSDDHRALLVVIELTKEFLSAKNWPVIDKVERLVGDLESAGKVPAGAQLLVTGSAVIGRDHTWAELQSARSTETLTVVLVVALLVLIYRAPLLALIPLATVFLAVEMSLHILALLAKAGHVTLFQGIQIYIIILAYGAGVDYCLFLTARYKEELDRGASPAEAVERAVGGVGAALAASAATVVCGIGSEAPRRYFRGE
jgi:RND superfamily putative drug exporter